MSWRERLRSVGRFLGAHMAAHHPDDFQRSQTSHRGENPNAARLAAGLEHLSERRRYNSRADTSEHIATVRGLLLGAAGDLLRRGHVHDRSKLESPEVEVFDVATPRLRGLTYGTDEYKAALKGMGSALEHHYSVNDHHPEFFEHGIADMDLLQVLEMLADWIAAARRHSDGNIRRSIELNAQRFGYGEETKQLLHNTVDALLAGEMTMPRPLAPPRDPGIATR